MKRLVSALVAIALSGALPPPAAADDAPALAVPPSYADLVDREAQLDQDVAAARQAILELERSDAGSSRFFARSAGFAVFPTVRSGVAGVEGAHGAGVLFEEGEATGTCQLTRLQAGLAPGVKTYTEVLFFETEAALAVVTRAGLTVDGRQTPVDAAGRRLTRAPYGQGLSVFTLSWVGSQPDAGVDGQRFACRPFLPRVSAAR